MRRAMKGFGTFLIGFGLAAVLAALTAWAYDANEVMVAEEVELPGVRLHAPEG